MNPEKTEPIILKIDEEANQQRLDVVLSAVDQISSRSIATKLINEGFVSCEQSSKKLKSSKKVSTGEVYLIHLPPVSNIGLVPYDFKLDIRYEDDHLLVVNKPAGLVVHPAAGHESDTLVNALINHSKDFAIGLNELRPGIIHRIDKDTSGLLVIAKNNECLEALAEDFKQRKIKRLYWAVCVGNPKFEHETIESHIGRHPTSRKRMSSLASEGKFAKTEIKKIYAIDNKLSLLKFKLHTGRTHQIRVHCAENNFPILGDWTYSAATRLKNVLTANQIKKIKELNRFCLHAATLGFHHPVLKKDMLFYSEPPAELKSVLDDYKFIDTLNKEFEDGQF